MGPATEMNNNVRAIIHAPVGLFVAMLVNWEPVTAVLLGVAFLSYEVMNDWRKHDDSYHDVLGYVWGLGAGGLISAMFI
jgi:hypothetical protein